VEVHVLDARGAPLAGAVVSTLGSRAVTDERGVVRLPPLRYSMGSPRMDRRYKTLTVRAPGYAPVHRYVGLFPWESHPPYYTMQLVESGGRLAGRCIDPEGEPVPRIWIDVNPKYATTDLELVTDEDGRFYTDQAPLRECVLRVASWSWEGAEVRATPHHLNVEIVARHKP
jgi:hypothetical protein